MSMEEKPDSAPECTGYTPRTPNEQKTIRIWNAIDVLHDGKASAEEGQWLDRRDIARRWQDPLLR